MVIEWEPNHHPIRAARRTQFTHSLVGYRRQEACASDFGALPVPLEPDRSALRLSTLGLIPWAYGEGRSPAKHQLPVGRDDHICQDGCSIVATLDLPCGALFHALCLLGAVRARPQVAQNISRAGQLWATEAA